eukprot:TRINITY_DN9118_c0_g1_i1.p1 TRINITY_DN9118_c0_g1~~TRINITY_DN9118_c0_g1_i1.p1  ORF type:complete len:804 (-),score=139.79 TRINITY_DN9118_c0_g1_i1:2-2413(-)
MINRREIVFWALSLILSTCFGLNHVYFLGSTGTIANPSQVFGYRSITGPSDSIDNFPVVFQSTLNDGITSSCDYYNFGFMSNNLTMGFAFGRTLNKIDDGKRTHNVLKGFMLNQNNPPIFQCTFERELFMDVIVSVNELNGVLYILTAKDPMNEQIENMRLSKVPLNQFTGKMTANITSFECTTDGEAIKFPQFPEEEDDSEVKRTLTSEVKEDYRYIGVFGTVVDLQNNYYYMMTNYSSVGFVWANISDPNNVIVKNYLPSNRMVAFASNSDGNGNFYGITDNSTLIKLSVQFGFNNNTNQTDINFSQQLISVVPNNTHLMGWDVTSKTFVMHSKKGSNQHRLYQTDLSGNVQWYMTLQFQLWSSIYYYSGVESPYCPNACQGVGTCSAQGTCSCDFGWEWDDCSVCDSTKYCNKHGICYVDRSGMRSCQCVFGYKDSTQCATCSSTLLCSSRGTCNMDTGQAVCKCNAGFRSDNCSVCDSEFFCNNNGQCNINGTCTCDNFWTGSDCSIISNVNVEKSIRVVNYITEIGWCVAFAIGLFALFMKKFSVFPSINNITCSGIQFSLIFYQSFVLLSDNSQMRDIILPTFPYFPLFNLDLRHGLPDKKYPEDNIWVQSMCFLPKLSFVLFILFIWKFLKQATLRGSILQIALWSHFTIVVSTFRRIAGYNCNKCSTLFMYSTTLVALALLALFFYLIYRLWKVVAEHEVCFDNSETDYIIEDFPTLCGSSGLWKIVNYTLTPWSRLVSYSFHRLFDPKKEIEVERRDEVDNCTHDLDTPAACSFQNLEIYSLTNRTRSKFQILE